MSPFNKRWLAIFISFFALFFLSEQAKSQLRLSETHADINQLTIGDIDFENFGSQHWFFTLDMSCDGCLPLTSVRLFVNVDIALADVQYTDAVRFNTEQFQLPRSISNTDIGRDGSVAIQPGSFSFSEEAKERIKDIALATGKLPDGTYTFHLRIEDVSTLAASDSRDIILTIQSFNRIELLSPLDNSDVPTPFPLFQWQFDGDRIELSVYEKMAHHQSNEEALNGTPHLVVRSGDAGLPEGVRTFQYPTGGVRALEMGKSYVWVVRSIASGTGGSEAGLNSEVWQFTVSQTGGGLANNLAEQFVSTEELANILNDIPGMDVEALKRLLEEYQMTGDIYINGQKISLTELRLLLEELLRNPDRIIEMKVIE
ncbi:MAG: hypothetical protein HYZ33_04480 [Ignavibacteriales bacterium]|nr:hypothetical protein [Ignavibacteriales bacterium]